MTFMKTQDLFKINRQAKKLNEGLARTFGKKINLENFSLQQLEDARNKLRTQISQHRSSSGFNENLENSAYHEAKFMLDAIVAELAEREEFSVDASTAEVSVQEGFFDTMMDIVDLIKDEHGPDLDKDEFGEIFRDMMEREVGPRAAQQAVENEMDFVWSEYTDSESEFDDSMDGDHDSAMTSAGFGSDEDYGDFGRNESIQGEDMHKVTEGEIQQASAIVTAKTMVDRVGRWIEELSGMENDTLLQLGDSIRDEMGQEQAKAFIEAVAPAIQQALENLKTTRETLATGVRTLTGEEQPAEMLGGGAPEEESDMEAEPDLMNTEPEEDEFAAAEPAAGGAEAAGREQRESIQFQNRLMKVLAG
jgi:hypothetical protein